MSGKIIEVDIDDLAYDGKSVGRVDGKVVFCNGGLPGERVRAEVVRSKPRYDQARVQEVIRKSDDRIEPRCEHFDYCGGCTWQDLKYERQLFFKKGQVEQCLQRLGRLEKVVVHDVLPSPEQFAYRNKMEFSFNVVDDDEFTLGLHRRGRWDEIFNLEYCHLCSPVYSELAAWMRDYVRREKLPIYHVGEHHGYMRFLVIREGINTGELMVNVVTNYGEFPEPEKLVAEMTARFPGVTTIIHNQNGQKSNIATGEIETVLFGPGFIHEKLSAFTFQIKPNSFFQTNSRQAERLYQTGFDLLTLNGDEEVLDLYCGTGSIGILISPSVGHVTGVELVPDAIEAARVNAAINHVENAAFYEGDVKTILKKAEVADRDFDVVIIDPPRAGLHPKALKRLFELSPKQLLYISCNPATFARDVKELTAHGYRLPDVYPVDMFPHTMHIEVVGLLTLD
jgi:23S rRNA (uracil1939-C5)-methyltransferase